MFNLLLVVVGGGIGAGIRHLTNIGALRLVGSFAMGLFIAALARRGGSNEVRLFVATGIFGGFTTFSAFSLDFATLWERGATLPEFGYALASVIGAIIALFLGLWLARSLP